MTKLASIFVMGFAILTSGYIGGAAFSFIFVILGYMILFRNEDEHIGEKYSEIWKTRRSYKPSRN